MNKTKNISYTFPYVFGFNGKEQDFSIATLDGANYDFGAREYDSRIGRWWAVDQLAAKYPNLSSYQFCNNNPILYIDNDGKDFEIKVNQSNKTIIIKATYYTTKENVERANNALGLWNDASGKYYYRTGSKKEGYDFYEVKFELTAQEDIAPINSGQDDPAGNSFNVLPDRIKYFKDDPNRGAFSMNKEEIGVRESRQDESLSQSHEVGHTLIGGVGHFKGTVMNALIEANPSDDNPGITNNINGSIIEAILGTAGLGSNSSVNQNKNSVIGVVKGEGMDKLDKFGKVITRSQMERQKTRQEKK